MITHTTRITLAFALAIVACGDGGGGGTGDETTTTSPSDTSSSESTSSTTIMPTTTPPETEETGAPCPFYGFEQLPMGNVGTAYEFIPDPTDDPDNWTPQYEGEVPGLELGATISGVPEEEGRFMITQLLAGTDGGQCQIEMTTLVIGPPLPGDSTGTETGTDTGTDSSGSSDSGSTGDESSSGSSSGA